MRDGPKILIGPLIALGFLGLPLLWNAVARAQATPNPSLATPRIESMPEKRCVEPAATMRKGHMQLLKFWRDSVVRRGERTYVASDGVEYDMSLQNTCLDCHSNKTEFCDTCHGYIGVAITCFDCHVAPEERP